MVLQQGIEGSAERFCGILRRISQAWCCVTVLWKAAVSSAENSVKMPARIATRPGRGRPGGRQPGGSVIGRKATAAAVGGRTAMSPSPVSDSSASEVRFKYQRRGSVVHDQMFDAVKLSDVSRLTLQLEQRRRSWHRDPEAGGNVLSMKSRLNQSQHVILAYESKLEELSSALREAQDRQARLEARQHHSLQQGPTPEGSQGGRGRSRSSRPRDRSSSWKLWTANV